MGLLEECRVLTDDELSKGLRFLAYHEKRGAARLIAHLVEFDTRQLCVSEGRRSLFEHCVHALGFEEFDAYRRVKAARFVRRYPAALNHLSDGKASLSALALLAQLPADEDESEWLGAVRGKTRREVEALLAARFPQDARPDMLRRMPPVYGAVVAAPPVHAGEAVPGPKTSQTRADAPAAGQEPAVEWLVLPPPATPSGRLWQDVSPISAERVRIGFDAASALMRMIERARQLLRHKFPEGRLEDVLREALELLLDKRDPQRRLQLKPNATRPPETDADHARLPTRFLRAYAAGRYIPAKVKTAVWARDDGRCAWRFEDGAPCGSRDAVEYDHIIPYAKGGRTEYRNLRLLCRAHNRLAAERAFPRPAGPLPGEPGEGA